MGQTFEIDKHQQGRRLDKILRGRWPGLPLGAMMKYFRKKRVRIDGKPARFEDRVGAGQTVYVPWDDPGRETSGMIRAEAGRLPSIEVIYADSDICLVNKPWNLLTQPVRPSDDSAVSRVAAAFEWKDAKFAPTAAHRLDRNTSGILVVALAGTALRALHKMWRNKEMGKQYLAIVAGCPKEEGVIRGKLEKDTSRNVVSTVEKGGKYSETRFRRLETDGRLSLLSVELVTGRPHQARAHLAQLGHPLLGDVKYGEAGLNAEWKKAGVRRPLLHARRVVFPGKVPEPLEHLGGRSFTAVPPDDILAFLQEKGWNLYGHRV